MKNLEDRESISLKNDTLTRFNTYLSELLSSTIESIKRRATLIISWLSHWLNYLMYEDKFNPKMLKRYSKGEIIKAQFGFNVDKELGGVHYALVLDKYDNNHKHTLTVVPLSSLKNRDKNKLGDRLYLGDEPKISINKKFKENLKKLKQKIDILEQEMKSSSSNKKAIDDKIEYFRKQLDHNLLISKELSYMNDKTIALTNQIKTISKMRIINPKVPQDALANITVPLAIMNSITNKIKKLYI
ncbi:MAG: type II toxin-antitoxin system PemK/MazF family toxin [Lachnospiraceae bacterium]|nr:type II toxin-antitoxin system PemK/MazF family toxin [Lachnospiraceae bacterium]